MDRSPNSQRIGDEVGVLANHLAHGLAFPETQRIGYGLGDVANHLVNGLSSLKTLKGLLMDKVARLFILFIVFPPSRSYWHHLFTMLD